MTGYNKRRIPVSSQATAEIIFALILIWLIAGPLSGFVLSAQTFITAVFAKGAIQLESTKNLAGQLFEASNRIKTLEASLAKAELEIARLRQQSRDTSKLRTLLGLKQTMQRASIAAEIVSRSQDNWFSQVVIDKGADDGVKLASAVITHDGVVGQVTQATKHAAVVRLLTDPETKLGVVIQRIGLTGILHGAYANPAKIDYVPVGTNVDIGDKIVCHGKGGVFPENHPIGSVVAVRRDTNGASMQVEVKLSENCYDLSQVLVLPPQS